MTKQTLAPKLVIFLFWIAAAFLSIELFIAGQKKFIEVWAVIAAEEPLRLATVELDNLEQYRLEATELMRITLTDRERGADHQKKIPELREKFELSWAGYSSAIFNLPREGKHMLSQLFIETYSEQSRTYTNFLLTLEKIEEVDLTVADFSNTQDLENLNNVSSDLGQNYAFMRSLLIEEDNPVLN